MLGTYLKPGMPRRWWRTCRCTRQAAALAIALCLPTAYAQTPPEYAVKAGFLYNFPKFVEWPAGAFPDANFVLCVVGADPFEAVLDKLNGKLVGGRPLVVKRYGADGPLGRCQILFVSDSERRRMDQILAAIGKAPVLLVGEMENFTHLGGMIQFVTTDKGIQFEVNIETARRHGLQFSARLLQLASTVVHGK